MQPLASTIQSRAWTPANPWERGYLDRELATMQGLAPFDDGTIVLESRHTPGVGIAHCYLRDDMMEWGPYPWLGERSSDGLRAWMAVTPMEIESAAMPIALAHGRVGLGGLGLGYCAQRILSKPDVDEVVVYETNPTIIDLYLRNFGQHPNLTILRQDVGTVSGQRFDLFYNDVYQSLLEPLAISHWVSLTLHNHIAAYHWWGFESWLLPLVLTSRPIPAVYKQRYSVYFEQWRQAVLLDKYGSIGRCAVLERVQHDIDDLPPQVWKTFF